MRRKLKKVDDIMTHKVISCDISSLATFALDKMKRHQVRSIVVTYDRRPIYILSRVRAMVAPDDICLSEMTDKMQMAKFVRSGTLVKDTYDLLRNHSLLIIEDRCREVIGVMSATDLLK